MGLIYITIQDNATTLESFLMQLPSQSAPRSNHCSDFYHHLLVLSPLELHAHGSLQYVLLCVCLLSLSMMFWDSSMLWCVSSLPFFIAEWYSMVWIYCLCLSAHLLMDNFWLLNAMNILCKTSNGTVFACTLDKYLGEKLLGHKVGAYLTF